METLINSLATKITLAGSKGFDFFAEEFQATVRVALELLAEHFDMEVHSGHEGSSAYFTVYGRDSSDAEDRDFPVFEVRASDHRQKYSGPVWSFDVNDDVNTHLRGLNLVVSEMGDYDADY